MRMQLNNYHIKLIAAISMVIDHVGVVFFPELGVLRIIGRVSFPLFCWLLAQGEEHTRNFQGYLVRLVVLGIVSQPLYLLALPVYDLNILFTLALGLAARRYSRLHPDYQFFIWIMSAIAAETFRFSYGAYGIALIGWLAVFRNTWQWWLVWSGIQGLLPFFGQYGGWFQFPAIAAPLILYWANGQKGATARWFYFFYPVHLWLIWVVAKLSATTL